MVRLAIPISENKLSPRFGDCTEYQIFDIDNKSVIGNMNKTPVDWSMEGLISWINSNKITDLVVHKIDTKLLANFADTKVNLFVGIDIASPDTIIDDYLKGELKSNPKL